MIVRREQVSSTKGRGAVLTFASTDVAESTKIGDLGRRSSMEVLIVVSGRRRGEPFVDTFSGCRGGDRPFALAARR